MGEGKGNAGLGLAMVVLCVIIMFHMEVAQTYAATTYRVGGALGWTSNVTAWPIGKRFKAGDILLFKYNPAFHNLVVVNRIGYKTCTVPVGAKVRRTGKDRIKLPKGRNYFICSFPGHCKNGLKIVVTAI